MTANDFRNLIASVYARRTSLADARSNELAREAINLRGAVARLEGARLGRANADLSAQAAVALERARATLANAAGRLSTQVAADASFAGACS